MRGFFHGAWVMVARVDEALETFQDEPPRAMLICLAEWSISVL